MPKNQQKQRGFQKVIVLWNVFKSKKTGSDFPLNRFSVCVNVFCGQKCTQNSLGNTAQRLCGIAFIIIQIITALVNGTEELSRCLILCTWMAVFWVLRYVLHSISTSLSHHATFYVLSNTRIRLLDKLAALPLDAVLDRSSGAYKNIIVERVDSIETTLAHLLPEMTANIAGQLFIRSLGDG